MQQRAAGPGIGVAEERAWRLGCRPDGPLIIDVDATLITAHSEKDGAAATYKRGFGFHPMMAYLDLPTGPAGGVPLAGLLRAGNAGASTAADHIDVLDQALAQLPQEVAADGEILVRCDSAGATHELLDYGRQARMRFSVGLHLSETVRAAILAVADRLDARPER